MSAHTPGPWFVGLDSYSVKKQFLTPRIVNGTICRTNYSWMTRDEQLANARLIAAAPELYEALKVLLQRYVVLVECGDCGNWDAETEPQVIAARAALDKVEA